MTSWYDQRERERKAAREREWAAQSQWKVNALSEVERLSQQHAAEREALAQKHAAAEARQIENERREQEREQARLAAEEESLKPVKAEKREQFFLTHPTASEREFDAYWSRIREHQSATLRERLIERTKEEMRQSRRYSPML